MKYATGYVLGTFATLGVALGVLFLSFSFEPAVVRIEDVYGGKKHEIVVKDFWKESVLCQRPDGFYRPISPSDNETAEAGSLEAAVGDVNGDNLVDVVVKARTAATAFLSKNYVFIQQQDGSYKRLDSTMNEERERISDAAGNLINYAR